MQTTLPYLLTLKMAFSVSSFALLMFAQFGLTIGLRTTNIMCQDVDRTPAITIGDYTLEAVDSFTYIGSTISSNIFLDAEINTRIGKASSTMAHLSTQRGRGKTAC